MSVVLIKVLPANVLGNMVASSHSFLINFYQFPQQQVFKGLNFQVISSQVIILYIMYNILVQVIIDNDLSIRD